jgi:hypothetical protein
METPQQRLMQEYSTLEAFRVLSRDSCDYCLYLQSLQSEVRNLVFGTDIYLVCLPFCFSSRFWCNLYLIELTCHEVYEGV